MIIAQPVFDTRKIKGFTAYYRTFPQQASTVALDVFQRYTIPSTLQRLRATPQPINGREKRIWQSDKQRKAYFATNGFGGGIPTKRTGKMVAGFKGTVRIVDKSAVMFIENPVKSVKYVMGKKQQRMHGKEQGQWAKLVDVVRDQTKRDKTLLRTKLRDHMERLGYAE